MTASSKKKVYWGVQLKPGRTVANPPDEMYPSCLVPTTQACGLGLLQVEVQESWSGLCIAVFLLFFLQDSSGWRGSGSTRHNFYLFIYFIFFTHTNCPAQSPDPEPFDYLGFAVKDILQQPDSAINMATFNDVKYNVNV